MTKKLSKLQHDLDKYCIFCIVFFVLYTIAELTVSSITGTTNDQLTQAVQWFCGGELFFCAMLKRLKIKKGDSNYDNIDRQLESDSNPGTDNSRRG